MKSWLRFVLVATFAIVLVAPMAAYGQHGTDRPFKATLEGSVTWEWPGDWPSQCTRVTTVTHATGQATHLGLVVMTSSHCPDQPEYIYDGRMTLTAANGDRLYGIYNYGESELQAMTVTFTGGTGRFAGASGSALMTYEIVPQFIPGCDDFDEFPWCLDFSVPWPWSATLTGTISY